MCLIKRLIAASTSHACRLHLERERNPYSEASRLYGIMRHACGTLATINPGLAANTEGREIALNRLDNAFNALLHVPGSPDLIEDSVDRDGYPVDNRRRSPRHIG